MWHRISSHSLFSSIPLVDLASEFHHALRFAVTATYSLECHERLICLSSCVRLGFSFGLASIGLFWVCFVRCFFVSGWVLRTRVVSFLSGGDYLESCIEGFIGDARSQE
ncbi:hypothetical protein Dimus_014290 [Dionaea muscipula]